jgi:hypothetical protein
MDLTYILVDFENIQPQDMDLLSGDEYQLRIFRGPHQKKLAFDIAESLQPLGDRVKYLQSDRHGKNALDLHIAFYMGRMLQELEANNSPTIKSTRFVVISHDSGFDALMGHVQSLGYPATKATSIRQALGMDALHAAIKPPGVMKAPPTKPTTTPRKTTAVQVEPGKMPVKKPQGPARNTLGPKDREKVIENLRLHPRNRPVKRKTLESHITSLVGGNVTTKAVQGLVTELENEGVVKFSDNKIEYRLPEPKK